MKNNFIKAKEIIKNTLIISKITGTPKKKRKIIFSILLLNTATFFDIISILTFASFFQVTQTNNEYLIYFIEKKFLLPIYVLIRFSFIYLEKINIKNLQLEIEKNLKNKIMNEIFSKGNYSQSDSFFYISQLSNHVAYFYTAITTFINVLIQTFIYFAYLSFTNKNVIIIFLFGMIFMIPITKYISKMSRMYTDFVYHENKSIYSDIQKMVENLFIIKIFKQNKNELELFNKRISNYKKFNFKSFNFSTLIYIIPNFLTLFALSLVFTLSDYYKTLTLEFIGVIIRFFQSIGELNKNFSMVLNSEVHIEKLINLQKNFGNDFSKNFNLIKGVNKSRFIHFKNVYFKYIGAEEYIFENLNFKINQGDQILLTGENGSGKSTLLGLISGVYYPEKGLVESSFNRIGYVGTETSILEDTLRNNLNFGNEKIISDKILLDWIRKIRLFIQTPTIDLDSVISSKNLSSGQKQKIAFIRMFLSDIDLLILDEATSNLDDQSRKDITFLLNNQNLTLINSTHMDEKLNYKIEMKIQDKNILIKEN